jgi:hypothetical protein
VGAPLHKFTDRLAPPHPEVALVRILTRGRIAPPALVAIANEGTTGEIADDAISSFGA